MSREDAPPGGSEVPYQKNLLFEHAFDAILLFERDARIIEVNRATEELLGYSTVELRGRYFWELVPGTTGIGRQEWDRLLHDQDDASRALWELRHRDGSRRFVRPRLLLNGPEAQVLGILHDVTAQHRMARRARESEELYRTTMQHLREAVFLTDDDGRFVFVGPNTSHIFDFSAREVLSLGNVERLMGSRIVPRQFGSSNLLENLEWEITDRSGRAHTLLVTVQRVSIRGGTLLYTCRDITYRRLAQEELFRREQEFRALAEHAPDIITRYDRDCRFLYANPVLEQVTGIPRSRFLGRTHEETGMTMYGVDVWLDTLKEVFRSGRPREHTFMLPTEGGTRHFEARVVPELAADGPVASVLNVARDTTERVNAEMALRQANARLRILHEIDRAILDARSVEAVARAATTRLRELLGLPRVSLAEILTPAGTIRTVAVATVGETNHGAGSHFHLSPEELQSLPEKREPFLIERLPQESEKAEFRTLRAEGVHAYIIAPIYIQGRWWGALNLGGDSRETFTEEHFQIAAEVAASVAIALRQAHLLQAEQRSRARSEQLVAAAASLVSTLELDRVLNGLLLHLERVVPYDSACVFLKEGESVLAVAARGHSQDVVGRAFPARDSFFAELEASSSVKILADARQDPEFHGWGGTGNVRAWLAAPMMARGRMIGYLTLDSLSPESYGTEEAALVQAFANQAALSIEKARLYTAERDAREEAEVQRAASMALARSLELDTVLDSFLKQLQHLVPYDSAAVMLRDEGAWFVTRVTRGYEEMEKAEKIRSWRFHPDINPPVHRLVQSGESLLITDTEEFEGWVQAPGAEHIRNWLGAPLLAGGEMVGYFSVEKAEPGFFTAKHRRRVEMLAGPAALAIQNAWLYRQIKESR